MNESRLEGMLIQGLVRMMGHIISLMKDLQSNISVVVVNITSFPCGKYAYTSFLTGNRSSSDGGSCMCHESPDKLGRDVGGIRRHPT